jgi:hypothetical protein
LSSKSFTVLPYTDQNLALALSNNLTSKDKIVTRMHYKYFCEYLGNGGDGLNARTILIEHKYISKSYLIDYSNYYSTCFNEYDRFCKRLHFFSKEITLRQFNSALKTSNTSNASIWKSYLGYIVVKPLPLHVIGATLLKTYESTNANKRAFPSAKSYQINLFGKELNIKSLAFQEQDSVVGACASSALWSAFHKTSQLFQTPLPSPSDITKSAKNLFQNSGRTYPNGGLDHFQIGNAIESVGLVSELRNSNKFTDVAYLKSFLYAYNKMGLPILLGIQFPGIGAHLIAVTGYKEENNFSFPRTQQMSLKASKIERLYAHDDQIGPFSRLGFSQSGDIITGWPAATQNGGNLIAKLISLFIPIHNKIRLTFEDIYSKVRMMDFYFLQSIPNLEIYWDIYLDFSNEYKKDIYNLQLTDTDLKYALLTEPLPKYVWIAKGCVNTECIIEFLFDATQIAHSDFCIKINVFNASLRTNIRKDLGNSTFKDYINRELGEAFFSLLEKSI